MAFFALLWKSRTIEKYRLDYEKEKINSIVMGNTHMEQTLSQRWRHYRYDTQKRISRTFKKWYPEGSGVSNFILYLKTDQTFPNFLLKSLMGFVGGIILTYLCFMFFVFQLSISLIHATIMSSIIGVLLTLGLAFSYRIRCLVFLLLPQLFSRVGRYTLTCYALVLILTGPATNTLKNSEVLSESMACTQEQIKTGVHQLDDLMKKPYNSMKYTIQLMIERFKVVALQMKRMIVALNRLVLSVVGFMQYSFSWLQSMSNMCNAKLGTPYKRCTDLLQDGIAECRRLLGPDVLCNIAYLSKAVCYTVKPFTAYCYVTDFMDEAILASIRKKIKNFTSRIRALFHVEIHLHHSYAFSNNSSRTASQVAAGIVTEIRNRTGPLLTWLSWSSCVTSLFLLLIIFRAKYYQHMYETRSRFDNRYVTKELQELDLKRQRQGRETVLPLNRRERAKYITTTSLRLVTSEKVYLTRSAVYMAITTFKLLIHMVADYSLYWVLMTIRHHGKYQSILLPGVPQTGAYVSDDGFGARLLRSLVDALNVPLAQPAPSLAPCLPDPYLPDFKRYTQIGVLIFLMWFFALFEPYGLRMRHLIMGQYRPERAKARATWLYNHILRTRAGFMKFARRKLHREYKYSTESEQTFSHWLDVHIPFQCLKCILGIGPKELHCLLCGTIYYHNDADTKLTQCGTPKCPGVYCTTCFTDIGQLCTICLSPADYGDLSDASLEKGSSDDSDSDADFYGTSVAGHNTRLINRQSDDAESRSASRRWKFFKQSTKRDCENNIPLMNRATNIYHNVLSYYRDKEPLENVIKTKLNKIPKSNRTSKTGFENANYNYLLDINNNQVMNVEKKIVCKTKSVGISTREHRSGPTLINLSRFIKSTTILVYKRQPKPPDIPKNNITKSNVMNAKILKPNKVKIIHNNSDKTTDLDLVQINTKKRKKYDSTISSYKLVKGVTSAMRYFVHNNNRIDSANKKEAKKINSPSKFDKMRPIDNSTPKDDSDQEVVEDRNKRKKSNKEKTKKVRIKTSRHKLSEFHTFFSTRWNNVKSNMVFHTTKKNRPSNIGLNEKKNHKRRKKRKDNISLEKITPKVKKAKKENKCNRNYRISAFLADRDWMKRDYNEAEKVRNDIDDSCRVTLPVYCRRLVPLMNKNKLVAMVHLTTKPFQWRDSRREEYCVYPEKVTSCTTGDSSFKYGVYRHNAAKALDRFRHKVNTMLSSPPSSLIQKMLSTMNMARRTDGNIDSSVYVNKRASFYRTFRNELMNQKSGVIDTDILFRNQDFADDAIPLESNQALRKLTGKKWNFTRSSSSTPIRTVRRNNVYISNSSAETRVKTQTTVERCKCDSEKKPTPTPTPTGKVTLSKRVKRLCSSLFSASSCKSGKSGKKPSCENARERERQLDAKRLCGPGDLPDKKAPKKLTRRQFEAALKPNITECREKCLPPEEYSRPEEAVAQNIATARALAKCREIELAKIKEIQRHIEKEKEIEREILLEQERHKEKEREIEREFGMELARHREKEKRLMCDGDSQTLKEEILEPSPVISPIPEKEPEKEPKKKPEKKPKTIPEKIPEKISCSCETAGADEPIEAATPSSETKADGKQAKSKEKRKAKTKEAAVKPKEPPKKSKEPVPKEKPKKEKKVKEPKSPPPKAEKPVPSPPPPKAEKTVPVQCECNRERMRDAQACGCLQAPEHQKNAMKNKKNAEASAVPKTKSCVCETVRNDPCNACTQDSGIRLPKSKSAKKEKEKVKEKITCTCATQYHPSGHSCHPSVTKKQMRVNYSPVCHAAPSLLDHVPFTKSSSTHEPATDWSPSPKYSTVCVQVTPVASRQVLRSNQPASRLKDTSVLAKFPSEKKYLSPTVCVKDTSILARMSLSSTDSAVGGTARIMDSPHYIKWSPVLSKHSIEQKMSPKRMTDTSVLAKFLSKSGSPRVRHLSTLTTLSPLEFTRMTDGMCSPTRTNRSTLNIFQKVTPKDSCETAKQKKKPVKDERRDKRRVDKPTHQGTHFNYHWKRNGALRGKEIRYGTRNRKLSLESSLFSVDNTNNDIPTTPTDSISISSHGSFSMTEDTKTDTTFCSLATVNYNERPRRGKHRTKVVTKANQCTSTERARVCDTGTITHDWWSPMLEKRETFKLDKSKGHSVISKQRREIIDYNENKKNLARSLTNDGKIVKFKSRTQIIPAGLFRFKNDVMSPSRYLLESQKYYNELFAYTMRPPRIIDCAHFNDKHRSSIGSRRNHRRTKRLDECYSPRRQYSPGKRNTDSTRSSESPRRRPYHYRRDDHRLPKKYYAAT